VRNVIVTGASRGIGLAIAQKLQQAGYNVIAVARHETAAIANASITFRGFDLEDIAGIGAFVHALRHEFGSIWGLVNNAAIGTSGILAMARDQEIERVLKLNTVSPLIITKYVLRGMFADGQGGRIVNIASIAAWAGSSGLAAYGASKAALIGATHSLARETGPTGITINAVAPGYIDTDMTHGMDLGQRQRVIRRSALRRLADCDDVADAVEFLISDKAKNITGTVVTVDAGSTV
jgi:3-oxoacyl-[acyl-carrier protein] reductase